MTSTAPARDLPQIAVGCPTCQAPAGELCTSHGGTRKRRHDTHQTRRAAWADAGQDSGPVSDEDIAFIRAAYTAKVPGHFIVNRLLDEIELQRGQIEAAVALIAERLDENGLIPPTSALPLLQALGQTGGE